MAHDPEDGRTTCRAVTVQEERNGQDAAPRAASLTPEPRSRPGGGAHLHGTVPNEFTAGSAPVPRPSHQELT